MDNNKWLLNEGARDNMLAVYIPLFQKRGIDINVSKLKQFLLNKFVTEAGIRQLSERSNYYLAGVARYYFNGDLTSNTRLNALYPRFKDKFNHEVCERLNALIKILRLSYIDSVGTQFEQPEDFGTLSLKQLFRKYNKKINQELGIDDGNNAGENGEVNNDTSAGKSYTYDILYSFEDAKKYYKYTEPGAWCITYGKQHYDGYIRNLGIHYVIFLMNGYEKVPRRIGDGFTKDKPHDLYGNSMIAVLQSNSSPEPVYITSRWNHGSGIDNTQGTEADHAYTKEEFLDVIGCDESVLMRCYEQWKRNKAKYGNVDKNMMKAEKLEATRNFKYMQMLLNGGMRLKDMPRELITNGFVIANPNEKNVENSVLKVTTTVNGKQYFTIFDRKRLMFDDIMLEDDGYQIRNCSKETGYIQFNVWNGHSSSHILYNTRSHQFVSVEGCKKFRYVGDEFLHTWADFPYSVVGLNGRQFALINVASGKTVRTRTGAEWFEGINALESSSWTNVNFLNKIRLPYFNENTKVIKLLYDSSANIKYLFSVETGKFIDFNVPNGFIISDSQPFANKGYIEYHMGREGGLDMRVIYVDLNTGELLNILGETQFNGKINIMMYTNVGHTLYYAKLLDGRCVYMLDDISNIVTFNGEPITKNARISYIKEYFAFQMGDVQDRFNSSFNELNEKDLLLNPFTGEFYHDEISGYWFSLARENYGNIYAINRKTGILYPIPKASEAQKVEMESIKNKFNLILEKLNRR